MKSKLTYLFSALLALLVCAAPLQAESVTLSLDNKHTYVVWTIKHLGFSTQMGKWFANGQLVLDKDHLNKSSVNVTINVADVITGIPELDQHLKSKAFFDTEKYPTATFVSDKVQVSGKDHAKVHGMLTLHGVSKPVILDVTLNKVGTNPISNKKGVGFTATASIKRSDFGMNTLIPNLGDVVTLQIGAEAYQDK